MSGTFVIVLALAQGPALARNSAELPGQAPEHVSIRIESMRDLIAHLDRQEATVAAIHVRAAASTEEVTSQARRRLSDARVEVWLATRMHTPAAAHFDPLIAPWIQGAAPYVEMNLWSAFNGEIGTQMMVEEGPEGRTHRSNSGWLLSERPGDQGDAMERCGWTSTLLGFFAPNGQTRDILRLAADATVLKTLDNGDIEVRIAKDEGYQLWLLDGQADYALKYAVQVHRGMIKTETTVATYHRSNRFVYPRELTRRLLQSDDGSTYAETKVSVESVDYDTKRILMPERFVLDFPPGYQVQDRMSGNKTIIIGRNSDELVALLNDERKRAITMSQAERHSRSYLALIALTILSSGVVIWISARRRSQRERGDRRAGAARTMASLMLLCLLASRAAACQYGYEGMRMLPAERTQNCGLNCACLAMMLARNTDIDSAAIEEIAAKLGCGDDWSAPTSLERIGMVLRFRGLSVQAFTDVTLQTILRKLRAPQKCVVVLHMDRPRPHFVVAARADNSGTGAVLVIDSGHRTFWVGSTDKQDRAFWDRVSPVCLVVSQRSNDPVTEPKAVDLASQRTLSVDFGNVDPALGVIEREVPVVNRSSAEIVLGDALKSCSCIEGLTLKGGGRELRPGQHGALVVRVDMRKVPAGAIERRTVLPVTIARREDKIAVVCTMETSDSVESRCQPYVVPSLIDFGRRTTPSTAVQAATVSVFVPNGWNLGSVTLLENKCHVEPGGLRLADGARGTVHVYRVSVGEGGVVVDELRDALIVRYAGREVEFRIPILMTTER